jgi:glutathione S-transferase
MTIQVAAFRWVPPFAQGFVRDLRVRWALEEAGLPYEAVLLDQDSKNTPDYRAWQPFGQVPAYRDGEVEMFESGAIVLHLAAKSEALAPANPAGRARVATWVLAALNTVEPHVQSLAELDVFHQGEGWTVERRPQLEAMVRRKLADLAGCLGDRPYLEGRFTAGDLMMTTVLRVLGGWPGLAEFPTLDAYRRRGEARPAFARALEAQLQAFREHAPA